MTRAPLVTLKGSGPFQRGNVTAYDSTVGWRFPNPRLGEVPALMNNGDTAENVAEKFQIDRKEQDAFALESHRRAVRAQEEGLLKNEIVSVDVPQRRGTPVAHDKDEGPRPDTSMEKLAALKPIFKEKGTVTAANSSPISDGAAALLVASMERARALGLKPMARIVACAVAGVEPS